MRKEPRSWQLIDGVSEWVGKITSFVLPVIIIAILWEVVVRSFFNRPTVWAHDLSAFLFGGFLLIGGAYTLRYNAHIKVDILFNRFSPRIQAIVAMFSSVFLFAFCSVILVRGAQIAWLSFQAREIGDSAWAPPLYPFKMLIPLAALMIILQGVVNFMRDLMVATRRDTKA